MLWFIMVYAIVAAPVGVLMLAPTLAGDPVVPLDGAGRPLTGLAAELFPWAVFVALLPAPPTAY
ncbi:MAG TPA: hypothetical protein VLK84_11190, partial [Longimicrobium sp.]|nr:hypothetical protein [Longimicrobium sp.]